MKKILILVLLLATPLCASRAQLSITGTAAITDTSVGQYQKFETGLAVNFNVNTDTMLRYFYTYRRTWAVFSGPNGEHDTVDGFWYQPFYRCDTCPDPTKIVHPGSPCDSCGGFVYDTTDKEDTAGAYLTRTSTPYPWRVRFASGVTGHWSYMLYAYDAYLGSASSGPYSFSITTSADKGYVKVAANGRNFCYTNNDSVFIPLGINTTSPAPLWIGYNRANYVTNIRTIPHMAAYGGNMIRLDMGPNGLGIEWKEDGVLRYETRQDRAFDLDAIVDAAGQNNVYLQVSADVGGEMVDTLQNGVNYWKMQNPYYSGNGGYVGKVDSFFTDSMSIYCYANRLRYILARWGYSPHLFSLEFFPEMEDIYGADFWDRQSHQQKRNWYQYMVQQGKRYNKHVLYDAGFAVSGAGLYPGGVSNPTGLDSSIFGIPELDYITEHYYCADYNFNYQRNYIERLDRGLFPGKPTYFAEYKVNWKGTTGAGIGYGSFTGSLLFNDPDWHMTLWTDLFSGAAGPAFMWGVTGTYRTSGCCWGGQDAYWGPYTRFLQNEPIFYADWQPIANTCAGTGPKDYRYTDPGHLPPLSTDRLLNNPTWYILDTATHPQFVSGGISTTNDSLIEVFGMKTKHRVVGWVNNKQDYWYNLPHREWGANAIDSAYIEDNQAGLSYPGAIPTLINDSVKIPGLLEGNYKLVFYSTYPDYPIAFGGADSNGGVIDTFTVNPLHVSCDGILKFKIPKLIPLAPYDTTAPYAPDYGFKASWIGIETPDTIWSNTTWNTSGAVSADTLTIMPGATLTVQNCTLQMPSYGVIRVLPGAMLHLKHATLTGGDSNCHMWSGVQVLGDANQIQEPATQGWLYMENGSVIENALVGATNWNGQYWNTAGGIVQCYYSSFVNNYLAVSLQPYLNIYPPTSLVPDVSYFISSNFTVDKGLKTSTDGNHYHGMVYLNGVAGVGFAGCLFTNRDTATAVQWLGYGIFGHDADFSLTPICVANAGYGCTAWQRCYFSGFEEGIHAEGTVLTDPSIDVSIDQSDFDSCSVGVLLATTNAGTVSRCNFNVGRGKWVTDFTELSCHQNAGVLVQNANAFHVEADTFYGYANGGGYSDWKNLGVVVENTGGNGNTIYKNTFYGMNIGCYANGNNGGYYTGPSAYIPQQPSTGLRIECNSFNNDTADIYVAGSSTPYNGIFYIQGGQDSGTHNTFYPSGSIYNYGSGVTYYYDSTLSNNKPAHTIGVTLSGTGTGGGCPLDFNAGNPVSRPGRAGPTQITAMESSFSSYQASYSADVSTYHGLMDAGNTDSLVYVIAHATNPTMLYVSLSGVSPYLSESSLWALKDVTILSHADYVGILGMNPETLRDSIFLSALQSYSGNPLTVSEVAALRTNSKTSTARSALESRMSEENEAMNDNAANLLRVFRTDHDISTSCTVTMDSTNIWFLRDSNSYFVYADSIGPWLLKAGSAAAQYQLAGYYSLYDPRDTSNLADSAIKYAVSYIAPSDSTGIAEYSHMQSLWKVLKALETSSRSIYDMTTTESDSISALAPGGPGDLGQVTAMEIINIVNTGPPSPGPVHPPPISCYGYSLPVEPKPGRSNSKTDTTKNKIMTSSGSIQGVELRAGCSLQVYPNPASSVVNFWYAVPDMQGKMTLRICDAIGKEIKRFEANGNEGLMNWEIEGAAPGMYIYTLSDEQGIVGIGKLVIER